MVRARIRDWREHNPLASTRSTALAEGVDDPWDIQAEFEGLLPHDALP